MRTKSKGFTLIELLVVIAIIGLLSSVVFASLNSARMKARDARRKADLHSLELAIQFYYDSIGTFPDNATNSGGAWPANYINQLSQYISPPIDPSNDWRYYGSYRMTWAPDANCNGQYVLWAYIEGANPDANTCGFGGPHYFRVLGSY
ncbi:MAG: type II secretion system protein [bacterium]|nr:type II secretion system protein [bacterium]